MMKLAALAILAAAAPAQQFDLVCRGTVEVVRLGGVDRSPYSRTLRIDLGTRQWCADACAAVDPIARIEPGRIVLRDEKRDTPREYWVERESVDRMTGEHSSMAGNDPLGRNPRTAFSAGHCEKVTFSGFVTGKTRF